MKFRISTADFSSITTQPRRQLGATVKALKAYNGQPRILSPKKLNTVSFKIKTKTMPDKQKWRGCVNASYPLKEILSS